MANFINYKDNKLCIGDVVKVTQKIKEGQKERMQAFEGILIAIKGNYGSKTITIRKIGANLIGIEKIFPITSTNIKSIEVTREGHEGVRRAKLYFIRNKSKKEIEKIYSRSRKKRELK